jgi:hypothetical protein
VFFHRGHRLRPELQELRMGIQKAEEAINNSIGCKLHNNNKFIMYFIVAEGKSSMFVLTSFCNSWVFAVFHK